MKKTAFVLALAIALASCGGAQQECVDCATDSTSVVDSAIAPVVSDTTAVEDSIVAQTIN
jgi:ABC-type glycerol-3-phosphate transport system substrate-binding protein